MKLAIADPPYLGRASEHYGPGASAKKWSSDKTRAALGWSPSVRATTEHPDAAEWDNPDTHRRLLTKLEAEYDAWAVALWVTSLPLYLSVVPDATVAAWIKPGAIPGGARLITSWEPVLVRPLRIPRAPGNGVRDSFVAHTPNIGHTGAKPRAWTRWVLDMLGYQDGDTVDDLFGGSGSVAAEIAQTVLL